MYSQRKFTPWLMESDIDLIVCIPETILPLVLLAISLTSSTSVDFLFIPKKPNDSLFIQHTFIYTFTHTLR